jgi:hypothetical protein
MSDEVKKEHRDNYLKVKAKVRFDAKGVEGTSLHELKILYHLGILNKDRFDTLRAERK